MSRPTPEQEARHRKVTCTLCRQRKPIDCESNRCPDCERYTFWRQRHMPDGRDRWFLQPWEHAEIARNVERYRARAAAGLPIFDDDGEESAA